MQIKLDEIEEKELARIKAVYAQLAAEARRGASHGRSDPDAPAIDELVEKHSRKRTGKS